MLATLFNAFGIGLGVVFVIALVIFGPLLVIWALNVLFMLSIAYSLKTWFAIIVLVIIIDSGSNTCNCKK